MDTAIDQEPEEEDERIDQPPHFLSPQDGNDVEPQTLAATRRNWLLLLLVIVLVLSIADWMLLGSYLTKEHSRLTASESVSLWAGELVSLVWLGWFVIRALVFSVPLEDLDADNPTATATFRIAILSILAALGVDVWQAVSLVSSQDDAFAQANQTLGKVERHWREERSAKQWVFFLSCSYFAANGIRYEATFRVRERDLERLPPDMARAIRLGNLAQATISYDRSFAPKCWLTALGARRENDLCLFVIGVVFIQFLGTFLFVLMVDSDSRTRGKLCWWHDLHGLVVVMVGLSMFFLVCTMSLLVGEPWEGA